MIEHGADINKADEWGRTLLHQALENTLVDTLVDTVKLLIKYGADVNKPNIHEKSPFRRTPLQIMRYKWGFEELVTELDKKHQNTH